MRSRDWELIPLRLMELEAQEHPVLEVEIPTYTIQARFNHIHKGRTGIDLIQSWISRGSDPDLLQ